MNKLTWNKIFNRFKEKYPDLVRRGIDYRPYGYATVEIWIPTIGRIVYDYDTNEIEWIERYNDPDTLKRVKYDRRLDMYYKFRSTVIQYLRDNDMTHQEFADMVNISRRSLSLYLNGDSIPKTSTMDRIGKVIGFNFSL